MNSKKKVFIIDDDQIFFMLMERMITRSELNASVTGFYNGELAMQYMEQNMDNAELLPDVIFVDLSMPIMDGWEFVEEIKSILPFMRKVPTIYVLSSSISPFEIERASKTPFVKDYLVKPILKRQLTELIGADEKMAVMLAS